MRRQQMPTSARALFVFQFAEQAGHEAWLVRATAYRALIGRERWAD